MSQQLINLGSVANDGTGSPLRTGGQDINANFTELYTLRTPVVAVADYGAVGDGVTDDTAAIQAAENARTAGQTLWFTPGKTYAVAQTAGANLLKAKVAGLWDCSNATIKYTGASNLTTGSDGGGLGVVNVLAADCRFVGTIDCNSKARYGIAVQSQVSGFRFDASIHATLETTGVWAGIHYAASVDVTGVAISGRAANVSGWLQRPSCPLIDKTNTITAHADVTALVLGSPVTVANATGMAVVLGGGSTQEPLTLVTMGALGVPTFISNAGAAITNAVFLDFTCYDLNTRHQERYGAVLDAPQRQTFSSPGAYTPGWLDNSGGTDALNHIITVSADVAVTIANPSNPAAITVDRVGRIRFVIRNTSAGSLTTAVTFTGTKYRVSATVSPGTNQQIVVEVLWDQTTDTYTECFRGAAVSI